MRSAETAGRKEREFVRVPIRLVAGYRIYRSPASEQEAAFSTVRNMSGNGLLLETQERIGAGVLLELLLQIPGWHRYREENLLPEWTAASELLTLVGTVVRCEDTRISDRFDVGVRITSIDPRDHAALLRYLLEYAEKNPE